MTKAGKVSLVPRDEFVMGTAYTRLDMVTYQDCLYLAKKDSVNVEPINGEYWMYLMSNETATADKAGKVRPDGITISVNEDGTISAYHDKVIKSIEALQANTSEGYIVDGLVVKQILERFGGTWIDRTDEEGNPTDEPYIHWYEEDDEEDDV